MIYYIQTEKELIVPYKRLGIFNILETNTDDNIYMSFFKIKGILRHLLWHKPYTSTAVGD